MNTFKTATDETLRETVRHGSNNYPFAYYLEDFWQFDFHRIDWHWHHEVEFLYAAKGDVFCLVGTDQFQLKKGCGLFVNSGILHRFEAKDNTLNPNIVFSPSLLAPEKSLIYEKYIDPVLRSSVAYQLLDPRTDWQDQMLRLLIKIFSLQETETENELQTAQLLMQIWDLLFRHLDTSSASSGLNRVNLQQARLQTMMQYIQDHYAEEITLEDIAASASVSKSGALHIFQTYIRISPVAYLIQYRLKQAAELLCTTESAVSSIAEQTGFTSAGYFCRKFRQHYCMSPMEYRRKKLLRF